MAVPSRHVYAASLGPKPGLILALAFTLTVAAADWASGYAFRLSILYLVPIAIATWSAGALAGCAVAFGSSLLWLFSFQSGHFYQDSAYYLWEALVLACSFIAFALLIARLRRALSQADERFFRVLETLGAAVFVADRHKNLFLYANPEMARIAGTAATPAAFQARLAPDPATPAATNSAATATADAASAASSGFSSLTVRHLDSGRWYLLQEGPIPWGSNPDVRLQLLTDITAQKSAERLREAHLEAIHQSARLATLAELAATVAHEINQPLMVIATYTDACQRLLASREAAPEEISRVLAKCHAQAVRAAEAIARLREFVARRQHRPSRFPARAAVSEALDALRSSLEEQQVGVEITGDDPSLEITADRLLLTQLLTNLIRNAVEAMAETPPARRRLAIEIGRQESGETLITVADQGPGVAAEDLEAVFKPFHTTKAEGLGLGLAISRSVAEAHGGRLWAVTEPAGGARFCLSLPESGQP